MKYKKFVMHNDIDGIFLNHDYDRVLLNAICANINLISSNHDNYTNFENELGSRLRPLFLKKNDINRVLNTSLPWFPLYDGTSRSLLLRMDNKTLKDTSLELYSQISEIVTLLLSSKRENDIYNGFEITRKANGEVLKIGTGLNKAMNEFYSLLAYATYYGGFECNSMYYDNLMYEDFRNICKRNKLKYKPIYKMMNLTRLLILASENKPSLKYNKLNEIKKSPIINKVYNNNFEYVYQNDLLYSGKFGEGAIKYHDNYNKILGYNGAFETLLSLYDNVYNKIINERPINNDDIKKIIDMVYFYYGEKYIRMRNSNAFTKKDLDIYKQNFKNAVDAVCDEFNVTLDVIDLLNKSNKEEITEKRLLSNKEYFIMDDVEEHISNNTEVVKSSNKQIKKLIKKYKLI